MVERIKTIRSSRVEIGNRSVSISPNKRFVRTLIHTGFIAPHQNPALLLEGFISESLDSFSGEDKVACVCHKAAAVLQGRYRRKSTIDPDFFCIFASSFGTCNENNGISIKGCPEKLKIAFEEVGLIRILSAIGASALEKLALKLNILKEKRGLFYALAGEKVTVIDVSSGKDGYNNHLILYPDVLSFFEQVENAIEYPVALVDINYLGGKVLGRTRTCQIKEEEILLALNDNPFGQGKERTPLAVIGRLHPIQG